MYGLDQNVLVSPYSILLSIILFSGVFLVGEFIQSFFFKNIVNFKNKSIYSLFSPIIGTYFLIYIIYLFLIFELKAYFLIKLISYILILLGFSNFFLKRNILINLYSILKKNFSQKLLILIVVFVCLFLISSSPITHADSIDYHVISALKLLNLGHLNKDILPMHVNLSSIGEIVIALGLSVKAEQFGAIVQFSSLLALIPIFKIRENKEIFLLLILTCPITLFLVSSPKPQLLFAITSLLIFIFLIKSEKKLVKENLKIIFPIIIFILSLNAIVKYSFILSSFLISIYAFYIMYKKKLIIYALISSFFIICITFLPIWIFRYINFDTSFISLISSPLPTNIYGYQSLYDLLRGGTISFIRLVIPLDPKVFTTSYGPLLIALIFLLNKNALSYWLPFLLFSIFTLSVFIFGSNLPRFLFEGYLWLVFLISSIANTKSSFYKLFGRLVYLQTFLILPIFIFFITYISQGSLTEKLRLEVMKNRANGYDLAQWSNQNLNDDDILLSMHRSISLFKTETYSNIYSWHTQFKDPKIILYLDFMKSKKINRILFYGEKLNTEPYSNCIGDLVHHKKNVGRKVGRNPFTKGDFYDGWIYEFKYKKLPDCLIRKF